MKIKVSILKDWFHSEIFIENFIKKLTFIGFESNIEGNCINVLIPHNRNNYNNLKLFQKIYVIFKV
jgi:hypothetical protein